MAKLGAKSIVKGLEFEVSMDVTKREMDCFTVEGYHEVLLENFPRTVAPVPTQVVPGDRLIITEEPKVYSDEDGWMVIEWENKRTAKRGVCYWDHFKTHTAHVPNGVTPKSAKKEIKILSKGPFGGLDIEVENFYMDEAYTHTADHVEAMYITFVFPGELKGARWITAPMFNKMKKNPHFKKTVMKEIRERLEQAEKTHPFFPSASNSDSEYSGKDGVYKRLRGNFERGFFQMSVSLVNDTNEVMMYLEKYLDYIVSQRGVPYCLPE